MTFCNLLDQKQAKQLIDKFFAKPFFKKTCGVPRGRAPWSPKAYFKPFARVNFKNIPSPLQGDAVYLSTSKPRRFCGGDVCLTAYYQFVIISANNIA